MIRALQAAGWNVEVASDGGPLRFLQKTFPDVSTHELPPYNIRYPSRYVVVNAVSQFHKMLQAVAAERQAVNRLCVQHPYKLIVSDNRYGCHHSSAYSVLITHQLRNIARSPWLSLPGEWLIGRYLRHFDAIWIPDTADHRLSGKLTGYMSDKVRFTGLLSDMTPATLPTEYRVAAILSGPEPQRTYLERELLPQLRALTGPNILIRGIIDDTPMRRDGGVEIRQYGDRATINRLLNASEIIVCRTGYSSLMDLVTTGARAILIPTPGQPEQVYLGERMQSWPQFTVQQQGSVDIPAGIGTLQARKSSELVRIDTSLLDAAVKEVREMAG